jgi:hypothetical protein
MPTIGPNSVAAIGRDRKFAFTPDSGHSIWRRLNGSSACRRTQQPDPERGNPPHRMRRIEANVRSQRRQARLRLKAFLLRQARRHPTRHRGPRPTNTGSRTCTSITKATLSRCGGMRARRSDGRAASAAADDRSDRGRTRLRPRARRCGAARLAHPRQGRAPVPAARELSLPWAAKLDPAQPLTAP